MPLIVGVSDLGESLIQVKGDGNLRPVKQSSMSAGAAFTKLVKFDMSSARSDACPSPPPFLVLL